MKISLLGLFHGPFSSIGHQKRDGQAGKDDALDKQLGFYFQENKPPLEHFLSAWSLLLGESKD
ncbi:hypothetical protein [Candidatus Methylacidiphilum infernorum]|uniref:hypothetical protein n=1 Tax=Candidatus Methylacidiphilum infernorum TaxID=511746 RepID=UPI00031199BE|nr:hypothetical protein [Candidatus Methylacidiphilum infernorum]